MACILQSWNLFENRRSKDDEVFKRIWKTVKTEAGKIGVVEAEGGRK